MDKYGNLHVANMPYNSSERTHNIHINPFFHKPKKSFKIHINPKVQLNVPVHVNPKMVSAFSTSGSQQREKPFTIEKHSMASTNILRPNIQKSVYVNPKLMQKLTKKHDNVPEHVNKQQAVTQLPIIHKPSIPINTKTKFISSKLNINKVTITNSNNKSINIKKNSPSKLVLISNKKLIRIRSVPKVGQSSNSSPQIINKKVKKYKLVNLDQSKKFLTINHKVLVKNKSKSFVNNSTTTTSTSGNNKYKIDRTKVQKVQKKKINKVQTSRCKVVKRANTNLINIDGVLYKSSKSQLVKSNNSNQPGTRNINSYVVSKYLNTSRSKNVYKKVKSDGKIPKLRRTNSKLNINKSAIISFVQKSNYKHVLSNRVKQKSIQILRQKMSKNNQPCLLYQRFGYCAKFGEGSCPKVHDKKQIALCKNFLQGKCLLDNCLLSHEVGPEKMPTCKYFLDGCCVRDSCQYLHVKVSANTPICIAFLRGYCEKGTKCKERHTNICPEFEKSGKCSKGKNCPYPHKSNLLSKQNSSKKLKMTTFNKQIVNIEKPQTTSLLPPRDESKKRYYHDNNLDESLAMKKMNILNKINAMKSVHLASEQNYTIEQASSGVSSNSHQQHPDKSSQPDSQIVLLRRHPIGPLPAYIPIE